MTQQTLERTTAPSHTGKCLTVAIYETHVAAERAVKVLQQSGCDMRKISIVARDFSTEETVVGYYNTGDRMKAWGKLGAFWGALWGLFFGSAVFLIPGIGPVLIAGPLVAAFVSALEGAVVAGGAGVLGAAFYGIGIPENSVVQYQADISAGRFLLLVHGTNEEVAASRALLAGTDHHGLCEHGA